MKKLKKTNKWKDSLCSWIGRISTDKTHVVPKGIYRFSAAAAAAVASAVSNSVRPHRRQPTRLPRPWDSLGKNTGVGCHFLLQRMKVKSESEVAQSRPTLATSWTAAH